MVVEEPSAITIENPVEMLRIFDDDFNSGAYNLYPWQTKIMLDFAKPSDHINPYNGVLRGANGSGKDRMIIAPCASWLGSCYPDTNIVITSASGKQLDRQTGNYINRFLANVNRISGREVWKLNYRYYKNLDNGSEINMFATDDAGMAEGWHRLRPGAQFAIMTSECKSMEEQIFQALHRCNDYTKRLDCSTPGLPQGYFFEACQDPAYTKYHVTAYDCPHLGEGYIEKTRRMYGENHFLFRSMILAEFGTTDEMVVIPYTMIYRLLKNLPAPRRDPFNTAGLDLSAGGDEQVLYVRCGNKLVGVRIYHFQDTVQLIKQLDRDFRDFELDNDLSFINADAGGLGKPILDQLVSLGWKNIRYIQNGGIANNTLAYANFGTELYFNLRELIEKCFIDITIDQQSADEKLVRQLSSRFYGIGSKFSKLQLESKTQAKAKGHPSPDRADALSLCFYGYKAPVDTSLERVIIRVNEVPHTYKLDPPPYYARQQYDVEPNDYPVTRNVFPDHLQFLAMDLEEALKKKGLRICQNQN